VLSAVIVFPGSNCDRDMETALAQATGTPPLRIWHREAMLPPGIDLVALPGGFSFGDYLRCGAIAARSPAVNAVCRFASDGGLVIGVCNGFQVLTEAGLLPGGFLRNRSLRFVCRDSPLRIGTARSPFTSAYSPGERITLPIAHAEGFYFASEETLAMLKAEERIAFRYASDEAESPNGSVADIAGVLSANRRVLGMMPHPERAVDTTIGLRDGSKLFESLTASVLSGL